MPRGWRRGGPWTSCCQNTLPIVTRVGLQVIGAFVMWIVGRRLIRLSLRLVDRSMTHHNDHYWQVYFETNRMIREAFGEAGFAAPVPTLRSVA